MSHMNALASSVAAVDALVDDLIETESKTLGERIKGNTIVLTNYLKHDGGNGSRETGSALLSNKCKNLIIVDIDLNKNLDESSRERIRNDLLSKLNDEDVVVKTASGGIHIYCNQELYYCSSNRMIKCYESNDFDIDIFSGVKEDERSLVVLPGSKVRSADHKTPVSTYTFIRGSYKSKITRSLKQVLDSIDVQIKVKQPVDVQCIIDSNKDDKSNISDELAIAIVNGLEDLEIHNDAGSRPLTKEITLFTLFQAINSLPYDYINDAYFMIHDCCKLTSNAESNYENARVRYSHLKTSPFVLVKILKIYRPQYYNSEIKPLLRKFCIEKIDLNDSFSVSDIRIKAEKKLYKSFTDVVNDLSKVIRFIDNQKDLMFVQKTWNSIESIWKLSFVTDQVLFKSLKLITLWYDEKKKITVYDALVANLSKFSVNGVKFYSNDPNTLSLFQGFKYNITEEVDLSLIDSFLKLIHDVIADSNEELYEYLINWISFIIQNPGSKTETALVLKGLQGIGKNRFTDVISELLSGYSVKNVTDISELTGQFNSAVEAKILIVLNELKNVGDERLANFNSLKSIITDNSIEVNEKFQPRRTAENVANFIFVTNNSYPVKIESGDRRYVVCSCNGIHKGDVNYWKQLCDSFTKEFYDNLLTYFMNHDITKFNSRVIPMTEAKQDIIDASRTPLEIWICDHYDELIEGIICSEALISKPSEMKDRTFQLQMKDKCDRKRKRIDGRLEWIYVLKDECKKIYSQTINEEEGEEFI